MKTVRLMTSREVLTEMDILLAKEDSEGLELEEQVRLFQLSEEGLVRVTLKSAMGLHIDVIDEMCIKDYKNQIMETVENKDNDVVPKSIQNRMNPSLN